jgi:ABC-type phosphate transport system substrate-binding protein
MSIKLLFSLFISLIYVQHIFADLQFIAHKDSIFSSLTKKELRRIYTGRLNKIGGHKVYPIILKNGPAKDLLLQNIISMSNEQFKRHWMKMIFTGKAKSLNTVNTEAELLEFIKNTPNSIGIVISKIATNKAKLITIK